MDGVQDLWTWHLCKLVLTVTSTSIFPADCLALGISWCALPWKDRLSCSQLYSVVYSCVGLRPRELPRPPQAPVTWCVCWCPPWVLASGWPCWWDFMYSSDVTRNSLTASPSASYHLSVPLHQHSLSFRCGKCFVQVSTGTGSTTLHFDWLVFCSGLHLRRKCPLFSGLICYL